MSHSMTAISHYELTAYRESALAKIQKYKSN